MTVLVFANGEISHTAWLRPYFAAAQAVIAADGGARHLLAENKIPNFLVGDLDSLPDNFIAEYEAQGTETHRFPTDKDETDLELALLFAAERPEWADLPILIFGVLGGRLDQMLANIMLLAHPRLLGRSVRLIEPFQQAWLFSSSTTIEGEVGDRVSLIPLGGDVTIASTYGLRWPLKDEILAVGPARGISNEIISLPARIELKAGLALCIHIEKSWNR